MIFYYIFAIIKRNKHSPIHPKLGRLANVYGAYMQVTCKQTERHRQTQH